MSTITPPRPSPGTEQPGRAAAPDRPGSLALRALLALAVVAVTVFWWTGTPSGTGTTPGGAVTALGELTGLVASVLVCAQVLLTGRVPWFERSVGLDRLVSWHRTLGTSVVLLVLTHVLLMVLGGALLSRNALWSQAVTIVTTQPEMLSAVAGTVLFVLVGATSARLLRASLSYEAWFVVHLSVYLGIYLTFGHQIAAGAHFVGDPAARLVWILLYAGTAAALLTWRVVLPLADVARHAPRVTAVVPEAGGMTSVWVSGSGLGDLGATAGQFFLVRFLVRGHLVSAHPYSVSAARTGDHLRFTIGALGDHSRAVARLRPGTRVLLEGPFGRFTAARARRRGVLLIAGGAGVGPVRALAEELRLRGHDVVVVHRARSAADLGLGGELAAEGIDYRPVVGRRSELGHDPLDAGHLVALVPDLERRDVFVCGPPGMVATVVRSARAAGVPRSAVHHEELSLS
ncbi:ferredoxin reductase family protein [Promicromonospora sukumoe]|uniref:ferredoxin reductase family protein n=1 Tax=Promicromonospora sukumoe TaxID=88382 RepID=UPI00036649DC|nr:ferredoxin reductase family protein [Promicromonospora sukumoe]